MGEFGKKNGGGRRLAARTCAPLIAVFTTTTRSHSAVLIDLSSTGARIGGEHLPEKGEELLLSVGKLRAFGTVKWVAGRECGVHLDAPLATEDIAEIQGQVARQRGLNPDLKQALDDWTMGFAR